VRLWIALRQHLDDDHLLRPDRDRLHDNDGSLEAQSLLQGKPRDRPQGDEDVRGALIVIRAFLVGAVSGPGHHRGGDERALRRDPTGKPNTDMNLLLYTTRDDTTHATV